MNRANDALPDDHQYYVLTDDNAIRKRWHLNKLRLFELTALSPADLVLDAGCGAGNLIAEIAPLCQQAIGCDYRYGGLAFAAARGRGAYVQADLRDLPFPDNTFTTVFCMEVIEHIDRKTTAQALAEIHRVLRSRGQLLVTTPNYRSLWVVIEFVADTLRFRPEMVGGEHISKYHKGTLADLMMTAGFAVERLGSFNHFSPFLAALSDRWAERLHRWELREGRIGGNLLYALCRKP